MLNSIRCHCSTNHPPTVYSFSSCLVKVSFCHIASSFWTSASVNDHSVITSLTDHLSDFRFVEPFPLTWPNRTDWPDCLLQLVDCKEQANAAAWRESSVGVFTGVKGVLYSCIWQLFSKETRQGGCVKLHCLGSLSFPKDWLFWRDLRIASQRRAEIGIKSTHWLTERRHKSLLSFQRPLVDVSYWHIVSLLLSCPNSTH